LFGKIGGVLGINSRAYNKGRRMKVNQLGLIVAVVNINTGPAYSAHSYRGLIYNN